MERDADGAEGWQGPRVARGQGQGGGETESDWGLQRRSVGKASKSVSEIRADPWEGGGQNRAF